MELNASTGATVAEWQGLDAERAQRISDQNARELDDLLLQARKENAGRATAPDKEPEFTLGQVLAEPQPLDLWPGHFYVYPKIAQLEKILPAVNEMSALYATDVLAAVQKAVEITAQLVRRQDGEPVSAQEIKERFDQDELAEIIQHIMQKQGLAIGPEKGGSFGLTGARSFQRSAATTAAMISDGAPI